MRLASGQRGPRERGPLPYLRVMTEPRPTGLPNRSLHSLLADGGVVRHVQVAVDGNWEEATRLTSASADVSTVARTLRPSGECAVEVFTDDALGGVRFLGVRFPEVARPDAERLLRELVSAVLATPTSFASAATWLARRIGMPLFAGEWSVVEVGVVDAWRSTGAARLADGNGEPTARTACLARLLEASTRIGELPPHA